MPPLEGSVRAKRTRSELRYSCRAHRGAAGPSGSAWLRCFAAKGLQLNERNGAGIPIGIGSGGRAVSPDSETATRAAPTTATMLRITARTLAFAPSGEVAQLVEHTTENRGVASSILALAIARTATGRPPSPRRLFCASSPSAYGS